MKSRFRVNTEYQNAWIAGSMSLRWISDTCSLKSRLKARLAPPVSGDVGSKTT